MLQIFTILSKDIFHSRYLSKWQLYILIIGIFFQLIETVQQNTILILRT